MAFTRMEEGDIQYLIVDEATRLYREATNSFLGGFINDFLVTHHVQLVEAKGGIINASNDMERLVAMIRSQIEYSSLKHKRENSMRTIRDKKAGGECWSTALGVSMVDKVVVFDQALAPVIREIFTKVARGDSYCSILRWLNAEHQAEARGSIWYHTNISNALKRGIYAGLMRDEDGQWKEAKNCPNPIISPGLFHEANRQASLKRAGGARWSERHPLPLSGILRCWCGRRMTSWMDDKVPAYRCINGGQHSNTFRPSNQGWRGQDFYTAIQPVLALRLGESLDALDQMDQDGAGRIRITLDGLRAKLKAKMRAIESDEDYEMVKDDLSSLKAQIRDQERLLEEEVARCDTSVSSRFLGDFEAILTGRPLEREMLVRLCRETFRSITVQQGHLDITLWNGSTFQLPRMEMPPYGRMAVPWSTLTVANLLGKRKIEIVFHYTGCDKGHDRVVIWEDGVRSISIEK